MFILVKGGQGRCYAFIVTENATPLHSNAEIGPTLFDQSSLNCKQPMTWTMT